MHAFDRRQTGGRTDRRTEDRILIARQRLHSMQRGKNWITRRCQRKITEGLALITHSAESLENVTKGIDPCIRWSPTQQSAAYDAILSLTRCQNAVVFSVGL